jgi:hypothetical protein
VSTRTATLAGTRRRPILLLRFDRYAPVPVNAKFPKYPEPKISRPGKKKVHRGRPRTLVDWILSVPGRYFDKDREVWVVHNPGPEADRVLAELNFTLDLSHGAKAGITSLADLATPWIELDPDDPWTTFVYPRFSDAGEHVPLGSIWQSRGKDGGDMLRWLVHTPDLRHLAAARVPVPKELLERGKDLVAEVRRGVLGTSRPDWPMLLGTMPRAPKKLPEGLPPLPGWAGRTLFGYQVSGAYSIVGGHGLLADEPGLGKTLQSIAAHALVQTRRLLVISPPVALTNWVNEIANYGTAFPAEHPQPRLGAGTTVMISAGRKIPDLPAAGAVVVPDSLLTSRPELRAQLVAWAPDGLIVDESHRHKNWSTDRARAVRSVAQRVSGLRVPISGTPMTSSPEQLASQLAISGHLDTVFGGLHDFLTAYCTVDKFGRLGPRKRALGELNALLNKKVWVRRAAEQVYNRDPDGPTMPEVLPPRAKYIDLDPPGRALYKAAITKQREVADAWLEELGRAPTDEEIKAFAATNIGFISPLRKAAGLAKIPAAIEYITDWITAQDAGGHDRPLLVWCHHNEVATAMRTAIEEAGADVAVIDGATSAANRGKITADFQAGRYKALVLSLQAAGVAITLTRACDNLFVESDWEPTTLTQARDRTKRIGQKRAITLTTLLATGTLDEHLQRVQRRKAEILNPVLGEGYDTSVATQETDDLASVGSIITAIVTEQAEARVKRKNTRSYARAA